MRKFFKFAALVFSLCVSVCSGCGTSHEDMRPNSYGEWDGNYIYCGNVRSKTTGENFEYLVDKVTVGGVEYDVDECTDCEYDGDDVYMCLRLNDGEKREDGKELTCLIRYCLADKTQETLFEGNYEFFADRIYKRSEKRIVLQGTYNSGESLFTVDYEGNITEADSGYYTSCSRAGDYLIRYDYENERLSYLSADGERFIPFGRANFYHSVEYFSAKNAAGFFVVSETDPYGTSNTSSLSFYDLNTGKAELLYEVGNRSILSCGVGYFIGYRPEKLLCRSRNVRSAEWEEKTVSVRRDCVLYYAECDAFSVPRFVPVYTFGANRDFAGIWTGSENKLYLCETKVESGGGCANGGEAKKYFEFDFVKSGLKASKSEAYERARQEQRNRNENEEKSAVCGKYEYFIETKFYGGGFFGEFLYPAYYLRRTDTETGRTETMRFWTRGTEYETEERGCREMWLQEYAFDWENVRYEIKNY